MDRAQNGNHMAMGALQRALPKEDVENRTQLPLVLGFALAHGHTRLAM